MSPQILEFDAIRNTHPTVTATAGQQLFDTNGNTVERNQTLIDAEVTRLQAEYDANQYQRDRELAYPSLTDQADMAYWDRQNGTTTLDDAITAVKSAYPKT